MSGLRDTLREATAERHRALEATPLMRAFARGDADPEVYAAYLAHQWAVHAAVEPALRRWLPAEAAQGRLDKAGRLMHDLAVLGLPPPPPCEAPAPPRSTADALGRLYVLEGATLGLRTVLRHLPADHPARGPAGTFVRGHGEAAGARWQVFVQRLQAVPEADAPEALAGAACVFAVFQARFERWCHGQPA